jgi:hypothetical protein
MCVKRFVGSKREGEDEYVVRRRHCIGDENICRGRGRAWVEDAAVKAVITLQVSELDGQITGVRTVDCNQSLLMLSV